MFCHLKLLRIVTMIVAAMSVSSCNRVILQVLREGKALADESFAPSGWPQLHRFMQKSLTAAHVVGFEAVIVKRGKVAWHQGYGYADLRRKTPMNLDTLFRVASVSKTFTAAALLRLYEQGKFQLDDDINNVLAFPVRHPRFPNVPITYRMLMTHSAGISDNYQIIAPLWNWQGDAKMPLDQLIFNYFAASGPSFGNGNFLDAAPGTVSTYSNMGITLLGYLVEVIGGAPFADVVNAQVIQPLGLTSASWQRLPGNPEPVASLYNWRSDEGRYEELGSYGYPEVPAGMLRISARHLAKFMAMLIAGGQIDGQRFLQASTVSEMERIQIPAVSDRQGLVLFHVDGPEGHTKLIGHNGGDPGIAAEMYWEVGHPEGLGIILLANTDATTGDDDPEYHRAAAFHAIVGKLLEVGGKL